MRLIILYWLHREREKYKEKVSGKRASLKWHAEYVNESAGIETKKEKKERERDGGRVRERGRERERTSKDRE